MLNPRFVNAVAALWYFESGIISGISSSSTSRSNSHNWSLCSLLSSNSWGPYFSICPHDFYFSLPILSVTSLNLVEDSPHCFFFGWHDFKSQSILQLVQWLPELDASFAFFGGGAPLILHWISSGPSSRSIWLLSSPISYWHREFFRFLSPLLPFLSRSSTTKWVVVEFPMN